MSDPMAAAVTEEELADQCQHVCLKPDCHEGPHFYGYRMGPWSQAWLVAEVRRLREDLQLAQRCIEVVRGAVEIRDRRIPEYQSRRDKAAAVLFGYDEIMRRRRGEPSMLHGTETVTEGHDRE